MMIRKKLEEPKIEFDELEEDEELLASIKEEEIDEVNKIFPQMKNDDEESLKEFKDLIEFLESEAKSYPYLDEYKILVLEDSSTPIIIMNLVEFKRLEQKIVGET